MSFFDSILPWVIGLGATAIGGPGAGMAAKALATGGTTLAQGGSLGDAAKGAVMSGAMSALPLPSLPGGIPNPGSLASAGQGIATDGLAKSLLPEAVQQGAASVVPGAVQQGGTSFLHDILPTALQMGLGGLAGGVPGAMLAPRMMAGQSGIGKWLPLIAGLGGRALGGPQGGLLGLGLGGLATHPGAINMQQRRAMPGG